MGQWRCLWRKFRGLCCTEPTRSRHSSRGRGSRDFAGAWRSLWPSTGEPEVRLQKPRSDPQPNQNHGIGCAVKPYAQEVKSRFQWLPTFPSCPNGYALLRTQSTGAESSDSPEHVLTVTKVFKYNVVPTNASGGTTMLGNQLDPFGPRFCFSNITAGSKSMPRASMRYAAQTKAEPRHKDPATSA